MDVIFIIANKMMGKDVVKYAKAFIAVFAITALVGLISSQVTFSKYLEYAFWVLLIGLFISNVFKTPDWLKPAVQTECYIKTGLVLMGASVLFSNIQKFGLYGLGIAWLVTPIVIIFVWYFCSNHNSSSLQRKENRFFFCSSMVFAVWQIFPGFEYHGVK